MIELALALLSGLTAAASAAGLAAQQWAERREERVAKHFKNEQAPDVSRDSDPRKVNEYLVQSAGPLTIREYATDAAVRDVVARVVNRVDHLLQQSAEPPAAGTVGRLGHLAVAREAIKGGDIIGALARMRLAVEMELRQAAEIIDLPQSRPGSLMRTVDHLRRVDVIQAEGARSLAYGIRLANGALHGEPVSARDADAAIEQSAQALEALDANLRERYAR